MVVLLDCTHTGRAPTLRELLTLMDDEDPMLDGSYMDAYSELSDFGVEDAFDVYALEECLLATFGCLGRRSARCLRQYARDKILIPLDLVRAVSEPPTDPEDIDAPTDEGRIYDWRGCVEDDEIEEVDGDGERKEVDEVVDAEEGTIDVAENEDEGDVSDRSYEV